VYPAHKDKEEIKCMGSVGGKTPIEPKSFVHSSLTLGIVNKIKLKSMTWVIRSEDEHESCISKKIFDKLDCLTHGRIV
jgi:hypothetical protein